ncbi:hypothetical protein DFH09DRAFT_4487 [Mycena vulgaris]|nr:hypothetical protein DFH09DRAFT_4487 [Mycena vulgaris]
MSTLHTLPQERVDDIKNTHRGLVERISLALDPEFMLDSDIDEKTLESLKREVDALKARTDRGNMGRLLIDFGADHIRDGLSVMAEQLNARLQALDPNYDPDFPSAVSGASSRAPTRQPAYASPSRTGSGSVASGSSLSTMGLDPASGPQRHTPSIRVNRDQATASPASRVRLSLPNDCQNFDVVFLPFKYDRPTQLPDQKLCAAQLSAQRLGLVFQVRLPRKGYVQKYFDCQVKSFCEDQQITLPRAAGAEPGIKDWVLMKRKTGTKKELYPAVLTPGEFNVDTLSGKPFALGNYLSDDGARKVLLIAPTFGQINGAINLPGAETPQMDHCCHVSRVNAAIDSTVGICERICPSIPASDTASSSRRQTAGRTLA